MTITTQLKKIPRCLVLGLCVLFAAASAYGEGATDGFIEEADTLLAELDGLDEWDGIFESLELSPLDLSVTVSLSSGYSDNVILQDEGVGSFYVRPAFDVYGTYLPEGSPWVFSIFEYGEARFFEETSLEDEYLSLTQVSAAREIDDWKLGLELGNIYSRQVVDVSDSIYEEGGLFTLNEPQFTVSIGSDLGERLWVKSSVSIARALYADSANNNWRGGYEMRGGYDFEAGGSLELYLSYERERYDTKASLDRSGLKLKSGERLELSKLRLGADYRQDIFTNWEWRTRVWVERETDRVGVYYDQWKGEVRQSISWSEGRWKLKLEGRGYAGRYDERYTTITEIVLGKNGVPFNDDREERQWRFKWGWQFSCGYRLGDHLNLELLIDEQELRSNRTASEYRAMGYELKMEYSF